MLLEAPHRIEALARDLGTHLGPRPVTLGRELTKQFEEIALQPADRLADWLAQGDQRKRGEFVLLVHARAPASAVGDTDDAALRVLDALLTELPVKTAVKLAAQITGAPRNALYGAALARKPAG